MSHELANHAETGSFYVFLHGAANIAHRIPNTRLLDPPVQRLFGHFQQFAQLGSDFISHRHRNGCIAVVAVQHHPAVDRNNIARIEGALFRRDTVHNLFVHRRAQHAGIIKISLEGRLCAQVLHLLLRRALQVHRGHARRHQCPQMIEHLSHHAAALPHLLDLRRRFADDRHPRPGYR